MFKEETKIEEIVISNDDTIIVKETTIVYKNDVEIARNNHRRSFIKNSNIEGLPEKIKIIAQSIWNV